MPSVFFQIGRNGAPFAGLVLAGMLALVAACGSDEAPAEECVFGQACECNVSADCPFGETCQSYQDFFICLPGTVETDTGTDADAGIDAVDTGDTGDTGPVCGDGIVDDGEACDDGNTEDGDGCDSDCSEEEAVCGDGLVNSEAEECDDGNTDDGDGCSEDCLTEVENFCGDDALGGDEECDDGNTEDGDGCSADCEVEPACGDGILDVGEECDDGNTRSGDGCDPACFIEPPDPFCGDGFLDDDDGEECDDGNNRNDDGCTADCFLEGLRYDGWVAYITLVEGAFERVQVIAGDRSEGPYEVPVEGRFSSAKYPSFSNDGTELYYALAQVGAPAIRIFNLESGEHRDVVDAGFTALRFPRLSPDGSLLLFSAKVEETPSVWNMYTVATDGSSAPRTLTSLTDDDRTTSFIGAGDWSCDGTQIYFIQGVPRGDDTEGSSDVWVMDADGADPVQVTVGQTTTSIIPSVRFDCEEVMVDSVGLGQPARVDLASGRATAFGLPGSDSNCVYHGESDFVLCERNSSGPPSFTPCTVGGIDCVRDIVILDIETQEVRRNVTQSIDARDTFPAVTRQSYTSLPLAEP